MAVTRKHVRSVIRLLLVWGAVGSVAGMTSAQTPPDKKERPTRIVTLAGIEAGGEHVANLFSIDPESGERKVLTDVASNGARVSPDGQTVIFNRDATVWNADTGGANNPGKLFEHKGDPYGGPVWSRDGKHIYLSCLTNKPGSTFWTHETWQYDSDGRYPVKLKLPASEAILDVSPDGKHFLTRSRGITALNASTLLLFDGDGKLVHRLSEPGKFNEPARFSPDGKRVAYRRGDDVMVVGVSGKGGDKAFGQAGVHVEDCCWSPDGKKLAIMACDYGNGGLIPNGEEARWRIEIVEVDGKKSSELPVKWGGKLLRLYTSVDWHSVPK